MVRAHPRACGENMTSVLEVPTFPGSSPRMRGKLQVADDFDPAARLIPAHAGKTPLSVFRRPAWTAHPRACGENEWDQRGKRFAHGSSPRMRGKRGLSHDRIKYTGLIPAHAGKTYSAICSGAHVEAHPRACGENAALTAHMSCEQGSSPRMRGKPLQSNVATLPGRLIPAHAGKTHS